MARATKILDFVSFCVWMVTGKLVLDFCFENLKKWKEKLKVVTSKEPPLKEKLEISKNVFCVQKFCLLFLNLYSTYA